MEIGQTIAVVGLGYIGLPTAAVLAAHGFRVVGVDIRERVVESVNLGKVPFIEPDLDVAVAGAVSRGWLRAQTMMPVADVYIIAVPTPLSATNSPDLGHVRDAVKSIAASLSGGELVVLESTSPPGTTQMIADLIAELRPDLVMDSSDSNVSKSIKFAHCPERVLPGRIMTELIENDRVVGGLTAAGGEAAAEVYRSFCKGKLHITDAVTAEMVKLVENAYRDVNIAFANELSVISERVGVSVWELIDLANRHPRVNILRPGPGVGGHCIAVDPWFLIDAAPEQSRLIRQARQTNVSKTASVIATIARHIEESDPKRVALLGLAYKPDIEDLRESPAVAIAAAVASRFPCVSFDVVEPHVSELPKELLHYSNVFLADSLAVACPAEIICVLVDHSAFSTAPAATYEGSFVIDVCGLTAAHRSLRAEYELSL